MCSDRREKSLHTSKKAAGSSATSTRLEIPARLMSVLLCNGIEF